MVSAQRLEALGILEFDAKMTNGRRSPGLERDMGEVLARLDNQDKNFESFADRMETITQSHAAQDAQLFEKLTLLMNTISGRVDALEQVNRDRKIIHEYKLSTLLTLGGALTGILTVAGTLSQIFHDWVKSPHP